MCALSVIEHRCGSPPGRPLERCGHSDQRCAGKGRSTDRLGELHVVTGHGGHAYAAHLTHAEELVALNELVEVELAEQVRLPVPRDNLAMIVDHPGHVVDAGAGELGATEDDSDP